MRPHELTTLLDRWTPARRAARLARQERRTREVRLRPKPVFEPVRSFNGEALAPADALFAAFTVRRSLAQILFGAHRRR